MYHDNLDYTYNPMTDCPNQTGSVFALILLICYILFLNILLVNLLIAIFRYLCTILDLKVKIL